MSNNLLFDFNVDAEAKTVYITREFNALLTLVWDAFTRAELLDQWVAPAPMRAKTRYMDFHVGGRRFYAMISPDGQAHWSVQKYTSINAKTNFKVFSCFADEDETLQLPGSDWDYTFIEHGEKTTVMITIYNDSRDRLQKMIEMGFKIGFTLTLQNLEDLLATLSQKI